MTVLATTHTAEHINRVFPLHGFMFDLCLFDSFDAISSLLSPANGSASLPLTLAQVSALPSYVGMYRNLRLKSVTENGKTFMTIDDVLSSVTTALPVKTTTVTAWALRFSNNLPDTGLATSPLDTTALPFYVCGEVGNGHPLTLVGGSSVEKDKKVRIDKFGFGYTGSI